MKNPENYPQTCWLLTTGEAGCFSQLKGLAERLGVSYEKKLINLPLPWKAFPGHLCPWPLTVTQYGEGKLTPPWPDLVLSCGRRTVAAALGIKKASKGLTKAIHIQDPQVPVRYFDAVIAPIHDGCSGANVFQTFGAIHHVTPASIKAAADEFKGTFAGLSTPRVSVLLGGTSRSSQFTDEIVEQLITQLLNLHQQLGCSYLITPSVRTPVEVLETIKKGLIGVPHYIWDRQGPNPYQAMLGSADYLLVTSDSVSMISEACCTGRPVYLIRMKGGSQRQLNYYKALEDKGFIRWFEGKIENWTYQPLDETGRSVDYLTQNIF